MTRPVPPTTSAAAQTGLEGALARPEVGNAQEAVERDESHRAETAGFESSQHAGPADYHVSPGLA